MVLEIYVQFYCVMFNKYKVQNKTQFRIFLTSLLNFQIYAFSEHCVILIYK
jgi:hypothetical protein